MTTQTDLGTIISIVLKYDSRTELKSLGEVMFRHETTGGIPINITKDLIDKVFHLSNEELAVVFVWYRDYLRQHKEKSGINQKNLNKFQEATRSAFMRILNTGQLKE